MKKRRYKRFGPFSYFRFHKNGKHFVDAWITGHENESFGWGWGEDLTEDTTYIALNLFGLDILLFTRYRVGGWLLKIMGFWYMT